MKIKVKLKESKEKIGVKFNSISVISDGGYEKGLAEGYDKGYKIGQEEANRFAEILLNRDVDKEINLTIPNGVKHLGEYAISSWRKANTTYGLRKINLNEVETMGNGCLQNNENLIEITAPNLTMLSYDCFYNNSALTKAYFPNVVTAAAGNSFRSCLSLKTVEFDKIELFVGGIFARCYVLDTLVIRTPSVCTLKGVMPDNATCFENGTARIYVPDNLVEQYKVATNWVTYSDLIRPLSEYVGE